VKMIISTPLHTEAEIT